MDKQDHRLNGDILRLLLLELLDLRCQGDWLKRSNLLQLGQTSSDANYSLIDDWMIHPITEKPIALQLAQERLRLLQNLPISRSLALEKAQLLGWQVYNKLEPSAMIEEEEAKTLFREIEECVKALFEAKKLENGLFESWFGCNRYLNQLQFIAQSIRLELRELEPPQKSVEKGMAQLEQNDLWQKELVSHLEAGKISAAQICIKRMVRALPEAWSSQALSQFMKLLVRLDAGMDRLENRLSKLSSRGESLFNRLMGDRLDNYLPHLIERLDSSLKQLCRLLNLKQFSPVWSQPLRRVLGKLASGRWQRLLLNYRAMQLHYSPDDLLYWKLWAGERILTLCSRSACVLAQQLAKEIPSGQGLDKDLSLALLVYVLALLQQALHPRVQLQAQLIEKIGEVIEKLLEDERFVSLRPALWRSQMDLQLLYHRDPTLNVEFVARAAPRLLQLYPSTPPAWRITTCLQLLEDFYDLWSGAAAP